MFLAFLAVSARRGAQGGWGEYEYRKLHKKYTQNSLRKRQSAFKLISKYRKPLGFVKPQYRCLKYKFMQNRTEKRAKTDHHKSLRPPQRDSSEFFYCHATVAPYRIPGQLHTERGQR